MNCHPHDSSKDVDPRLGAHSAVGLKRILVADDDAMVRAALAGVLESEGYLVDQAPNGIEAVTRAIERSPDLVLLDLNMPHWDGWKAFARLEQVKPLLPVIVITAQPDRYEQAVALGVDAFMEKPLNIPVLLGAIKHLVNEQREDRLGRIADRAIVTHLLQSGEESAIALYAPAPRHRPT
jgi:CheY-like chemotaxis protein